MSRHRIVYAFAAAVFLMLPAGAASQEVGVKAGLNSATLTPEEDEDPDTSRQIGPIAGGWVRVPFAGNRYSFQLEGLYGEKGVKYRALGFSSDVRLHYLEFPLLGRVGFAASGTSSRAYLVGGGAPAFNVSARGTVSGDGREETRDIGEAIKAFDFGLVGGGGVEVGRVSFEVRYTHGLLHINTDDNGDEDRIKNRVFSVMAGFRFR